MSGSHIILDIITTFSSTCTIHFAMNDDFERVGGRLRFSLLNNDVKHPILLPSNSHLTTLVSRHYRLSYLHGGLSWFSLWFRTNYNLSIIRCWRSPSTMILTGTISIWCMSIFVFSWMGHGLGRKNPDYTCPVFTIDNSCHLTSVRFHAFRYFVRCNNYLIACLSIYNKY